MAQLNIKPAGGQKIQLQRHTGANALTVDTHGDVQVAGTITTGTMTNAVAVPHEIIKKIHSFSYGTRHMGNNGADVNQFQWTNAFTPLDPTNNAFHVAGAVICLSAGNDQYGYGLRFAMPAASAQAQGYGAVYKIWDFFNKGMQVVDSNTTDRQAIQGYNFVIRAGELKAGTYEISHRTETQYSQMSVYNPSTTDEARHNPASQSQLVIIEFGSIH